MAQLVYGYIASSIQHRNAYILHDAINAGNQISYYSDLDTYQILIRCMISVSDLNTISSTVSININEHNHLFTLNMLYDNKFVIWSTPCS